MTILKARLFKHLICRTFSNHTQNFFTIDGTYKLPNIDIRVSNCSRKLQLSDWNNFFLFIDDRRQSTSVGFSKHSEKIIENWTHEMHHDLQRFIEKIN